MALVKDNNNISLPIKRRLLLLILLGVQLVYATADGNGILYPQASEKRRLTSLDGLWNFRAVNQSKQNQGFDEQWFNRPLKQVGAHLFNSNISSERIFHCHN